MSSTLFFGLSVVFCICSQISISKIITHINQWQRMQEELPKQPQSEPLSHLQQQPQQPRQASSTECLRFTYNVTPSTKQQLHSCTIPTTVHFTPLHVDNDPPVSNHADSLVCHTCGSYLNRYCQIMGDKMWVCCICGDNNVYRKHEAGEGVLGEEMYQLLRQKGGEERKQKLYLFVVDLCISQKELKSIKKCMLEFLKSKSQQKYQGVNLINRVALITYSKFVYCYQLSSQLNTVISISAQKMYDTATFLGFLGLGFDQIQKVADKCFVNVKAGLGKLEKRVKKLKAQGNTNHQNDPVHRCRARRALGQAFNIALNLCECLQTECRIISFIGGPCTYGIGMTIGTQFQQHMRSITEYQNGENVHYFEEAQKFYNSLRQKAEGKRSVIDTFIFSVQQTGLTEMYELARATGGLLVLGEQFSNQLNIFQQSFKKAYITSEDNDFLYSLTSSAIVSITCSKDIKINGLLGNCKCVDSARGKRFVSDKSIGHGQTNMWYIGSLNCYRTLTFAYQLSSPKAFDSSFFMQFKTAYKDYWGFKKIRIVTVKKHISVDGDTIDSGFDQEAAVVALARWYIYKLQFQPKTNLRQWLDKLLVKWASRFADYTKGDPESFALPQKMKFLPQFLYHFRRNPICRRTGISLDQLIYQMHTLNNETIQHSICIIQPALLSYSIQKPEPSAVKLQEEEMRNSVILLLDTYFHVIMWYGENIEYWEKQGFHKQKQYQHVKTLLEAPQDDLKYLLKSRFPYPGFYKTCSGHSKERILKSKISPMASQVHNQNTLTDDKSVYAFMKALIQIVVK